MLADDRGRGPVFQIDLRTDTVTRPTGDDAVFADLQVSPDGSTLCALRSSSLALPDDASQTSPAPLALWIHRGPVSSESSWSWRWNPWLLDENHRIISPQHTTIW